MVYSEKLNILIGLVSYSKSTLFIHVELFFINRSPSRIPVLVVLGYVICCFVMSIGLSFIDTCILFVVLNLNLTQKIENR